MALVAQRGKLRLTRRTHCLALRTMSTAPGGGEDPPTRAAVVRSGEDEQALRFLHRTEDKPDPTIGEGSPGAAGEQPVHRPAIPVPVGKEEEYAKGKNPMVGEQQRREITVVEKLAVLNAELTEAAAEGALPS